MFLPCRKPLNDPFAGLLMSASASDAANDGSDENLRRKYLAILETGVDFLSPFCRIAGEESMDRDFLC